MGICRSGKGKVGTKILDTLTLFDDGQVTGSILDRYRKNFEGEEAKDE